MRKIVVLAMTLIMTGAFGLARAEPLAPLAKLDDGWGMMLKPADRKVPDASKMGIPAYPVRPSGNENWNFHKFPA